MPNPQWLDAVSETIRSRMVLLMGTHGVTSRDVGQAIGRGDSWMSEFLNAKRGTDDLRLVIALARYFHVPITYLLGIEQGRRADPGLLAVEAMWPELKPSEREIVLQLARQLHQLHQPNRR